MPIVSRGFRGRRPGGDPNRLPPGQYVETDFPVLSVGPTPRVDLATWTFSLTGEVDEPKSWSWEELLAEPAEEIRLLRRWLHDEPPARRPHGRARVARLRVRG